MAGERPFTAFLIAGEESGDQLGAGLMRALSEKLREGSPSSASAVRAWRALASHRCSR